MTNANYRCSPGCLGWFFSHSDKHGLRVERCDECDIFDDDEEASRYVQDMFKDMAKTFDAFDRHGVLLSNVLTDELRKKTNEISLNLKQPWQWKPAGRSYLGEEELKVFRANMYCTCEEGAIYECTDGIRQDEPGGEHLYEHKCNKCGRSEFYNHKFPKITYHTPEELEGMKKV